MRGYIVFLIVIVCMGFSAIASALDFRVESFRILPNDVSAFISPVKDLNNEDCALVKVIATEDFVFSTPLGIVERIDNTGEIWLYIPRKSKKITIKHPKYGVLRDYIFPEKIESHLSYEMRIDEPPRASDIPMLSQEALSSIRDTLILTRTDTVVLERAKKKVPFSMSAYAVYSIGGNTHTSMAGIMLTAMKAHGAYLKGSTDFGKTYKEVGKCDEFGYIEGNCPFYTGKSHNSAFQITAGAIHRLSGTLNIFEGIGYGSNRRYWQKAVSEGGGYVLNSHYSYQGVLLEIGMTATLRHLSFTASLSTIEASQWFGSFGIGYKF